VKVDVLDADILVTWWLQL